ncbi:hypothetical protein C8R44DRAFT_885462 [Mycena epipterygia]|nr:hypothetical protein C8R44DRAFT_885462 [Mycena epipterygia]
MPKRSFEDTLYADSSEDSAVDDIGSDDTATDDEVLDYYYESVSRDASGKAVYTSTVVSAAVSASPSKPGASNPFGRPNAEGTWIYDFMDNDWAFPGQDLQAQSDSESEAETKSKREPYKPLKKWKEGYRWTWLNELLRVEGRGDHAGHPQCVCGHPHCKRGLAEVRCKDCDGHETDGIDQTPLGACALECPACPHPGKNLPPEWKDVAPEKRFLYALFLALDANFRMQRKDVSSETSDPDLGNGLAFFGEVTAYMAHLEKNWDQPQPKSTCVAHDAVNTPDKEVRGTASSGVGTVDCAHHNMKRPKGVGDLQKGERYLNMDYMFFKSLEDSDNQLFFVSYDIACQWHKNIWDRMQIYPRNVQLENDKRFFVFLVPKFHLPAHIEACNIAFSFLLTPYVGQTDGEAPERGWANVNRMATSTREMGPQLRREVWGYTCTRIRDYIPAMVKTRAETLEQEQTLPSHTLAEWKEQMAAWEADAAAPNPFERTTKLVNVGSKRVMLEWCSKARRKVLSWMDTQTLFMPEVAVLRTEAAEKRVEESRLKPVAGELVQDMPLLLLSGLDAGVPCVVELQNFEFRLREGQAHGALHEMRHQLLVRTYEYLYKDDNVRGVRDVMRSNTKIAGIDDQIARATATYNVARKALEVLGPRLGKVGWENVLKVLRPEDVRQMPAGTFRKPGSERRKEKKESVQAKKKRKVEAARPISWIWLADGSAADADRNKAMNEALRIEWARTRALGHRNTEEVDLLEEEMRRTPVYLRWRADWWESQKIHNGPTQRPDLQTDARQREGHDAYATRQAGMLRGIAARFEKKWETVPALLEEARTQVAAAEAKAAVEKAQRPAPEEDEEREEDADLEGESDSEVDEDEDEAGDEDGADEGDDEGDDEGGDGEDAVGDEASETDEADDVFN